MSRLQRIAQQGVRGSSPLPLVIAAANGRLDLLRLLVKELGADFNEATHDGATPLYVAAQNGHLDVVRCLVRELGVDINQADKDGATPLLIAAQNSHLGVVKCLGEEFGANANTAMLNGTTPLHMVAFNGHLDVVRFLVEELGADVNHASQDGRTALGSASAGQHRSIAAYLIKKGANPQAVDATFGTAADVSRRFGAPAEQTAYLEAKMHCTNPGCSGAGIKKCTGCKQARYCGQPCQLAHWPAHKADCTFKRLSSSVGPGCRGS
jgi:ankyrin repeat protein